MNVKDQQILWRTDCLLGSTFPAQKASCTQRCGTSCTGSSSKPQLQGWENFFFFLFPTVISQPSVSLSKTHTSCIWFCTFDQFHFIYVFSQQILDSSLGKGQHWNARNNSMVQPWDSDKIGWTDLLGRMMSFTSKGPSASNIWSYIQGDRYLQKWGITTSDICWLLALE